LNISFVGGGNMAQAMIRGLLAQAGRACSIAVIEPDREKHGALLIDKVAAIYEELEPAFFDADVIVLAVKPNSLERVCGQVAQHLRDHLVLSVAAGVTLPTLSSWLCGYRNIVRVMPNTPASVGFGVSGAISSAGVTPSSKQLAESVMGAVGKLHWCEDEADMDVFGVTSGSGPAYVFYLMEAMHATTMRLGFEESQSAEITLETFRGAVELAARSTENFSQLRERVTSKGGATAAAIASFDAGCIKGEIERGILAALARTKELATGHQ
jgi:pyrroline-5-carboxylate reductase